MKKDIKLSPDGDLVLGQQAVDEDGYLLYYQNRTQEGDSVRITKESEGNIPIRDVDTVFFEDFDLQLIKSRIQTDNPDWTLYPNIGANLSDLIGEMNNRKTAEMGIQSIRESLTYDGAFTNEELTVEAIPVSSEEIFFDIKIEKETMFIRYAIVFNVEVGIMNAYEIK